MTKQEQLIAISWLCEFTWSNIDNEEIEDLTEKELISAINKYYDGGMSSFLRDNIPLKGLK